jgi:hypothetical protein
MWIRPDRSSESSTLLDFDTSSRKQSFSIHHHVKDLVVRHGDATILDIEDVFQRDRWLVATITSGANGTSVYLDGKPAAKTSRAEICPAWIDGQLVLGTSAIGDAGWRGTIRGLAVFARELRPAAVGVHVENWRRLGHPTVSDGEREIALYRFSQRDGAFIQSDVDKAPALFLPARYKILHPALLEWSLAGRGARWYWKDVIINVTGFIPLGLCFSAYWSWARPVRGAAAMAIALGIVVSLMIEVLQWFLPTRHSDLTDVLTNAMGTIIGALLCRMPMIRKPIGRYFCVDGSLKG